MNNFRYKTITFSGVDGAGKSTVIDILKKELELMDLNIIQMRSRPQILPILSSFKYGKNNAEKIATDSLPRQGSNKSNLSSLLRFSYYYLDYILGQLYFAFRYRGKNNVILYDRYYFDYIIDPKRANISINKNFIKFLYLFIKKPDLNFFLYAPAEEIFKRKKELDKETITELTDEYILLFSELNHNKNRYFTINNISLDYSISSILKKIRDIL